MKKLFVRTYGCQMNAYDSARMADLLAPLGYVRTDAPEGADMVILNTCHIREKAAEKVYSELGRLRALKAEKAKAGGRMWLAVAGCVAQAEGEEIVARAPAVDLVVGPQSYHRLPEMIAKAARESGHVLETDFPALEKFDSLPAPGKAGVSAFLPRPAQRFQSSPPTSTSAMRIAATTPGERSDDACGSARTRGATPGRGVGGPSAVNVSTGGRAGAAAAVANAPIGWTTTVSPRSATAPTEAATSAFTWAS